MLTSQASCGGGRSKKWSFWSQLCFGRKKVCNQWFNAGLANTISFLFPCFYIHTSQHSMGRSYAHHTFSDPSNGRNTFHVFVKQRWLEDASWFKNMKCIWIDGHLFADYLSWRVFFFIVRIRICTLNHPWFWGKMNIPPLKNFCDAYGWSAGDQGLKLSLNPK